jgi:hypothetical protein
VNMPRYPIYVISKGRYQNPLTPLVLRKDKVPFRLIVEPQEEAPYRMALPDVDILVLPFSNLGLGSIPARNWVWEHAKANGHLRHWILDDNIHWFTRRVAGTHRIVVNGGIALQACEDFADRYQNVGILSLNYDMFMSRPVQAPPFYLNHRCYSCLLIDNALPMRWRGRYNEDTDLCLQVLAAGLCTVLINAFLIKKVQTGVMKGGNTSELYKGDGRLKMARSLERMWPGVVETKRRFKRPQHKIKDEWGRFDTPLKLKPGIDLASLPKVDEYGMELKQVKPIKSQALKQLYQEAQSKKV